MSKQGWYDHILVIDRSVWRCGDEGPFKHGSMNTQLHHEANGMMCCLGQACLQSGVTKEQMGRSVSPFYIRALLPKDSYLLQESFYGGDKVDSKFSAEAMAVNDSRELSRSGRELALFMVGKRYRVFIQFTGSYTDGWSS